MADFILIELVSHRCMSNKDNTEEKLKFEMQEMIRDLFGLIES